MKNVLLEDGLGQFSQSHYCLIAYCAFDQCVMFFSYVLLLRVRKRSLNLAQKLSISFEVFLIDEGLIVATTFSK